MCGVRTLGPPPFFFFFGEAGQVGEWFDSLKSFFFFFLNKNYETKRKMTNDDEKLEAMAAMLERLALEIRETIGRRAGRNQAKVPVPEAGWKMGARVRVTIHDRYYDRTGVLMGRRGRHYWDLRLDPRDGECSIVIYKKQSSLRLVDSD